MKNAIEAFRQMTFSHPEPKASARARYLAFADEVINANRQMTKCLSDLDPCFHYFYTNNDPFLSNCVVDRSLASYLNTNRVVVDCAGNGPLAHVGDAYLSWYVARKTFSPTTTTQLMQGQREKVTCEKNLCAFYDLIFDKREVIVRWRSPNDASAPTSRQRAEFIESLIGAFHLAGHAVACDFLCELLFSRII